MKEILYQGKSKTIFRDPDADSLLDGVGVEGVDDGLDALADERVSFGIDAHVCGVGNLLDADDYVHVALLKQPPTSRQRKVGGRFKTNREGFISAPPP